MTKPHLSIWRNGVLIFSPSHPQLKIYCTVDGQLKDTEPFSFVKKQKSPLIDVRAVCGSYGLGGVVEFVDLLLLKIGDMIQWIGTNQILRYFPVRF